MLQKDDDTAEHRVTSDGVKTVITLDFSVNGYPITLYKKPGRGELNLLSVLAEAGGTPVHYDTLCTRLHRTLPGLRVTTTYLRRKLTEEWIIHAPPNRGMALIRIANMEEKQPVSLMRGGYHDKSVRAYDKKKRD